MTIVHPDVEIRRVVKKYGSNVVLNEINLDVKQGELLTLLGPSGCGKTTTLNTIAGFIHPDEGELFIKGKKMNEVPTYKRDLGMVFQGYSLFPHMTVYENLDFGLKLKKVEKIKKQEKIKQAMELVRMSGLEGRYPRELSGGQRQRVAIARALIVEPTLLLLDEPLSNLDAKLRNELRVEIKRLQKELGVTTIFVTHDQQEALSMSDRIVVMNQGKIEQIGSPIDIYKQPQSEFVFQFIGNSNCLHATVETANDREWLVKLSDQWVIQADINNIIGEDRKLSIRDQVKMYIRPESLKIESLNYQTELTDENEICKQAQIVMMNYLGSQWEIEISLQGAAMQVVSPTIQSDWSIGSEVLVRWERSDMRMIKK